MTTETKAGPIPIERIAADLQAEDLALTLEEQARYPVKSWRATHLSHPCEAYAYFMRTAWREAELPSPELQDRFEVGKQTEPLVLARVERVAARIGGEVRRVKDKFHDGKTDIGGEVDALLRMNEGNRYGLPRGTQLVLEVKTVSPYLWDSCRTIEDLKVDEWMGRYFGQVTIYMFLSGLEHGLFVVQNLNGQRRYLPFSLDYALADALLAKAGRLSEALTAAEPQIKRIAKPSVCRGCPVFTVCKPPLAYGPGAEFADEAELIAGLRRRADLLIEYPDRLVKDLEKLDKAIKTTLKEAAARAKTDTLIVGDWMATLKTNKAGAVSVKIEPLESVPKEGDAP